MPEMPSVYFKQYRSALGTGNKADTKEFFAGKDVKPLVDHDYLCRLTERLEAIIRAVDSVMIEDYRPTSIDAFIESHIWKPKNIMLENNLISRLTNQGRRPEQVFFAWLRGFVFCEYFCRPFSAIFDTEIDSITRIGEDDFRSPDSFKRTPTADLEVRVGGQYPLRLEVQSGFQGINDVKTQKIKHAKAIYAEKTVPTLCVHIDVFNGQVAFIPLHIVADSDANFVIRTQMEGQEVLNIAQEYFIWRLLEHAPSFDSMGIDIQ